MLKNDFYKPPEEKNVEKSDLGNKGTRGKWGCAPCNWKTAHRDDAKQCFPSARTVLSIATGSFKNERAGIFFIKVYHTLTSELCACSVISWCCSFRCTWLFSSVQESTWPWPSGKKLWGLLHYIN